MASTDLGYGQGSFSSGMVACGHFHEHDSRILVSIDLMIIEIQGIRYVISVEAYRIIGQVHHDRNKWTEHTYIVVAERWNLGHIVLSSDCSLDAESHSFSMIVY